MNKINYLLLVAFSFLSPTYATITIVDSGTIQPSGLALGFVNDIILVEEGAAIVSPLTGVFLGFTNNALINMGLVSGATDFGVNITATSASVINSGIITGVNAGILNNGDNTLTINNGRILTESAGAFFPSFQNQGDNAVIINNGLISSLSSFAVNNTFGAVGANLSIINSGSVISINNIAINNDRDDFTLKNSGVITTNGDGSVAVATGGENTLINNNGLIFGGLLSNGAIGLSPTMNAMIVNSGILASAGDAEGVIDAVSVENLQIINAGTIQRQDPSTAQFALNLTDPSNPTLTLLRGSNIEGGVFVDGDFLNLNVETGLNLALTLDPASSDGFGTLGIEAPFVLLNDTVLVIDPTGFAMQNDVLADLSDTVFDGIYRHRTGFACPCPPCDSGVWVQGIGSSRGRSIDSKRVGYDNWQGGFLVGYDTAMCLGYGSVFGGISSGEAEVDGQTQMGDWTTYLAGLAYEWLHCNTYLGLAYAIGYIDWNNDRFVMNNLADGGVQTASFDTGGAFLSAEVTVAQYFPWLLSPTFSFTFRYAGLFLGDYREKGSDADLSVKDRQVDLLTTRLEVAFPYQNARGICCWVVEPYFGLYGRYQVGGHRVDAILAGQPLCFDPGNPDDLVAFLLGFRGTQSLGPFNLFINLEGSFDSRSSARILGEGGLGFRF